MFTRLIGFVITPLWLAAMSWLVVHDVWPHWSASAPPALQATEWLRGEGARARSTIEDDLGRVGTVWTEYLIDERSIRREDLVWIERLPLDVAPVRIRVDSIFTAKGVLDELTIRLEQEWTAAKLHGERFHSDFSFTFECGAVERSFKIPLAEGGLISGAFHPFSELTGLRVGQRWRMQVVNPLSSVLGMGSQFIPLVVEVTGEERISTPDGETNCLVVESPHAKAWVDARGVVQTQEMTLPMVGRMRIVRQAGYGADDRTSARNHVFGRKRSTGP